MIGLPSPKSRPETKRGRALSWLFFVGVFFAFFLFAFTMISKQSEDVAVLKQNGTLVTATVAEVKYDRDDGDYYTRYRYEDDNGKVYTGSTGREYGSFDSAAAHLGETIDIYIDASGDSIRADFPVQKGGYDIACIVLEILLCCIVGAMILLIVSMLISRSNAKARGEKLGPMPVKSVVGLLAIFGCIGLMLYGIFSGRTWLLYTTMGLFFGGGLLLTLILIILFAKRIKASPANESDEVEREREQIDRIDSTTHIENKTAMAEYQIRHIQKAAKAGNGKGKALTILLLVWLFGTFVGVMVFAGFGLWIGSVVCGACFAGTIIVAMLIVVITQRLAMSPKSFNADRTYTGTVTGCHVSSSTSYGGRYRRRLRSVTYKVYMIVEGEEKTAYSHIFFAEGETVPVHLHKNPKKNTVRITDEFMERNVYKEGAIDVLTAEYERLHADAENEGDEVFDYDAEQADDEEPDEKNEDNDTENA